MKAMPVTPYSGKLSRFGVNGGVLVMAVAVGMLVLGTNFASAELTPAWGHHPTVGSNIDISGTRGNDWPVRESSVAVDPEDSNILAAGAIDTRLVAHGGHVWDRYYRSTDGGATWTSAFVPGFPGDPSRAGRISPIWGTNFSADPMVAFSSNGDVYFSGVATTVPPGGTVYSPGGCPVAFVAKYVQDGAHYVRTALASLPGIECADFPRLAVDDSGGPRNGTVYVSVADFLTGGASGNLSASVDGGRTFSAPVRLPHYAQSLVVDPRGILFAVSVGNCRGNPNCSSNLIFQSTDGGASFLHAGIAGLTYVYNLANPSFAPNFWGGQQWNLAVDAHGLYLVYPDWGAGHHTSAVKFTRSTDGGRTWSAPRVLGNARWANQFEPTIAARNGVISVAWYDARNGQAPNGNISGFDVYYSASFDHGQTFTPNLRVTSTTFDPGLVYVDEPGSGVPTNSPWLGEYIWVAAGPHSAHVTWTDNLNACTVTNSTYGCMDQDILTATVTY